MPTKKFKVLKENTPVRVKVDKARYFGGTGIGVITSREPPYYMVKLDKPIFNMRARYTNLLDTPHDIVAQVKRSEIEELPQEQYNKLKKSLLDDVLEKERSSVHDARSLALALQRITKWQGVKPSGSTTVLRRV